MSNKQVGRAAYERRKISFRIFGDRPPIRGYVVGSDDFHWFVGVPTDRTNDDPYVALVHKTCPLVVFTNTHLEQEDEESKTFIQKAGQPFWEYCGKTYRGLSAPNDEEPAQ